MPTFIRVRDKNTGDEYDVAERSFNEDIHTRLNATKQFPDLTGPTARPRPARLRTDKAGQPATTQKES